MKHPIKWKKLVPKSKLKRLAFFAFLVAFLVSAGMLIREGVIDRRAERSYTDIQTLAREARTPARLPAATPEQDPDVAAPEAAPVISMDFAPLKKLNPEIVGWIFAEGTKIDYPLVRTDNNEFYIDHLYDKTPNAYGAIFLDYRCMADFSDPNTVIYGHHMGDGTMFASLKEYQFQNFYDAHPTMELWTPQGDFLVELICATIEDGDYEFARFDFDSDQELLSYVEGFRERSTFVSPVRLAPGDRIVSLCTCTYEQRNARFQVIGRLVPVVEET